MKDADAGFFLRKQLLWFLICLFFFFIIIFTDYTLFSPLSRYIYLLTIIMLVATLLVGRVTGGSQRWLSLGGLQIQPSELAKIFIVITLSSYFVRREETLRSFKTFVVSIIYISLPFILIFKQPDLGTSLVFLFIWWVISYSAGVNLKYLFSLSAIGIVISPLIFNFLRDYQKKRLIAFLNPAEDPLGAGYHIIQSKIAIGSGGTWGKGMFSGTQSQLNFIPGQHTDFIFSSLGEEFGLLGCMIVLILFFILIWRGINIALSARDDLGKYICVGVVSMFIFQIFVNIGMTMGLMPVVGIPLPFLSYGGSSLLANTLGISLLLSVKLRKDRIRF